MTKIQTAGYSDVGGREWNEDCIGECRRKDDTRTLIMVADGLGGHGGGDRASAETCRTVCEGWDGSVSAEALVELIRTAHRNVQEMQTVLCVMKSTAVVLAVTDGQAAWAHVGDSRLYHFRDGKLVFQTRDHSASQIAVMLGDITPDQIRFHEDRNRVLRALGQEGDLNVESREEALELGQHAFLLCSDGFWEYVLEPEMEADLQAAADPEDWLARMRERLTQRIPADNDNNTAAVLWL